MAAARSFFYSLELKNAASLLLDRQVRADRIEAAIEDAVGIDSSDPNDLQPVAKRVAERKGIRLQPRSSAVAEMPHALHAAMIEHAGRQVERLEGVPPVDRDSLFAGIGQNKPPEAV